MLRSVPKENLNIWEEDVYSPERQVSETDSKFNGEISNLSTELLEIKISGDTKEVTIMITGYIVKKLSKIKVCAFCIIKKIADETNIKYDEYLRTLSRRDLIYPSPLIRL